MVNPIQSTSRSSEIAAVTKDNIRIIGDPPEMILIVGPCRSGTTALSNVFARAGLYSYMQPIKSMRRAVEEEQPIIPWIIDGSVGKVLSKETLGAKTEAEFFDPIEELVKISYPLDKIHLIGICREPRATLGSWVDMWGTVPMSGFIESFKQLDRIMKGASQRGIRTTYYVQEALGANDPAHVVRQILSRAGVSIPISGIDAVDWEQGPVFGDESSNIAFFDNPPEKFVAGVKQFGGYRFRLLVAALTKAQDDAIRSAELYDIYRKFARNCERDLNITILE